MLELEGKYTKAIIYADTIEEGVPQQVYDIINCPAFKDQKVVCMPDVHVGASGPCGLVATIGEYICPEHIGVDIGCSVSMMVLSDKLTPEDYPLFEHRVKSSIPSGFKINEHTIVNERDFRAFLTRGFSRYRQMWPEMLGDLPDTVTEEWISKSLRRVGMDEGVFWKSLGSIGGGNHFIEYDEGDEIAAVTLHFGSRHFGVKICKYWMSKAKGGALSKSEIKEHTKIFKGTYKGDMKNFKSSLDKYLDGLREGHIEGYLRGDLMAGYLCDMTFAQLYAEYNHKVVQEKISEILKKNKIKVTRIIKSTHNYIDLSDRVLRKSAIRSYPGEEILVPFNMRDGIAICEGLGNSEWLNSCSHGAGRRMSRNEAKRVLNLEEFKETMKDVYSTTVCQGTIDESPEAYKDTSEIIRLIEETCRIKCFLKPKINIKAAEE